MKAERFYLQRKNRLGAGSSSNEPVFNSALKIFPEQIDKKNQIDSEIREEINDKYYDLLRKEKFTKQDQKEIGAFIHDYLTENKYYFVDLDDKEKFIKGVINDIFGLGILQNYLNNPEIQEIWVLGHDKIYFEKDGKRVKSDLNFKNEQSVRSLINKILAPINRRADESSPYVDGRTPDGSRVAVTLPPLSLIGPQIVIRKFKEDKFLLDDYVHYKSASEEMSEFLKYAVKGGLNILVAGGTGSGKTTLLNALTNEIPQDMGTQHIITIEDSAELKVNQDFVSSWETKKPNSEGEGAVTASDLVKHSLRNSPDRIVIGEIRDAVAYDVLQAASTGHKGNLTTIHSEDPKGTVKRFTTLAATAGVISQKQAEQIFADTFDLVVYVSRIVDVEANKVYRKITQITYIAGYGEEGTSKIGFTPKKIENKTYLQDIFNFNKDKRKFQTTGFIPKELLKKMRHEGVKCPVELFAKK